jgi:reactive intermediate/imine deaminase
MIEQKHTLIQQISSENAPKPLGTYSQAVKANGFLFVSGQLPISPDTGEIVSQDPIKQTKQCFDNLKVLCDESGSSLSMAVKIQVYYTDLEISESINAVMEEYFSPPYPARIRVKVAGLSKNAKVEIDGIFLCPN